MGIGAAAHVLCAAASILRRLASACTVLVSFPEAKRLVLKIALGAEH